MAAATMMIASTVTLMPSLHWPFEQINASPKAFVQSVFDRHARQLPVSPHIGVATSAVRHSVELSQPRHSLASEQNGCVAEHSDRSLAVQVCARVGVMKAHAKISRKTVTKRA
jgi:hypothetical protein